MLLSSFFTRSMAFAFLHQARLPLVPFSRVFITIRQSSLDVTAYKIVRSLSGYLIHPLSPPHDCDTPDLATQLTGNYRDWTCTGWHGPASLDALQVKVWVALRHPAGGHCSAKPGKCNNNIFSNHVSKYSFIIFIVSLLHNRASIYN